MTCTRCSGTGFLNAGTIPANILDLSTEDILTWMNNTPETDVTVCACSGNGETWHGEPGQHYTSQDPRGRSGVYAYNGGLCECH